MFKTAHHPRRTCLAALMLVAATFSGTAHADLLAAQAAYRKGDFTAAFEEFHDLAQLGQPTAQFNLAVMYARGEGIPKSDGDAYAWAEIAADNHHPQAPMLAGKIRRYLAPDLERRAEQVRNYYSAPALADRLMPMGLPDDEDDAARSRCLSYPEKRVRYPLRQLFDSGPGLFRQAGVFVAFTLMPDGSTQNWRVLYAIPREGFDDAARSASIKIRSEPAPNGLPLDCTAFYLFIADNSGVIASDDRHVHAFAAKTLKQAQNGDPLAQLHYAMMIQGVDGLGLPRKEAIAWFLKSAQSGSPEAQFVLGYCLLKGVGVLTDQSKALFWLRKAASNDEPEAKAVLAAYALRDQSDPESIERATSWLTSAVDHNSQDGILYYSALLATASDAARRDPERCLQLLGRIQKQFAEDPRALEIRAAAEADLGRFADAIKDEQTAINMGRALGWNIAPLAERRSSYEIGKAWSGDLIGW
jgi:TPR repeat protein